MTPSNAERFESWVFDKVLPTIHRTGSYQICEDNSENSLAERKLALEEMQLRLRMSEHLFSLANVETISENYRTILIAKSAEMLTGEQILMLPKTEQKNLFRRLSRKYVRRICTENRQTGKRIQPQNI